MDAGSTALYTEPEEAEFSIASGTGEVVTSVICPHSTQWTQDEIQQMTTLNHKPGRQTKP